MPKAFVDYYISGVKQGKDYNVTYKNNVNAGTATMTITGVVPFQGSITRKFTIVKAANTMKAKAKAQTVKYKKLKKKTQTIKVTKAFTVEKPIGKVTYKVTKYDKKAKKKIKVSKTGKVTIKKGLKKGTYKVKVKVTAKGNINYKSKSQNVTLKIKIK